MPSKRYLSAQEATARLGVSTTTLYAYVSRGLIRSEEAPDDNRRHRYPAEDIQKLIDRQEQRHDPTRSAQTALHWGGPVLESGLTLITETGLYYRGQDATLLAQTQIFEEIATLLWTGTMDNAASLFNLQLHGQMMQMPVQSPIHAMQVALAIAADQDLGAYNLVPHAVTQTGAQILKLLTSVLTGNNAQGSTIAAALSTGWKGTDTNLINAALILCADHELNASSFAARIVASTGANPYAVVLGGLATLEGFKHGGVTRRVSAFLREAEQRDIQSVVREYVQRGDTLPGFGHRLYPNGDPRARTLLTLLDQSQTNPSYLFFIKSVCEAVYQTVNEYPTIDLALVTLERALNLPSDSALSLFALGRTAGWIGHAIEEYASHELIRPRAKYIGKLPTELPR